MSALRKFRVGALVLALLGFGYTPAHAQANRERRVAISLLLGSDLLVRGPFNEPAETSGRFGTSRVLAHSFGEIFNPPLRIGGELSVGIAAGGDLFVRLTHASASSRGAVPFAQSITLSGESVLQRSAMFGNYTASAIEIGWRQYISAATRVRPFVGGSGGVVLVDAISVDECCEFAGSGSRLYESSRTPMLSAIVGVDARVASRAVVGIESGVHYQSGLTPDLSDLRTGPYITKGTFPGRRWSIPVTGALRVRF